MKTTDSLTTKLNRLSQDLRLVDNTFSRGQSQLNAFAKSNTCHDSIMYEFLSQHSNAVNRAFVSLLRLAEIQDILHQFASLEARTLFGFPHLPSFLHSPILSRLLIDSTMHHTSKALSDGFPLFINPMVDIEHKGSHVEASVLLTLPEIPDNKAFCTVETLTPLKFNSSNTCYTGPMTKDNLVLLTCPHTTQVLNVETLTKCYQDSMALICPTNLLKVATNISWLGFPFNLDSKLTFPRHHIPARDCTNLHPLLNLGGRTFLATTTSRLRLRSGTLITAPLAVYQFPCNESFDGMVTGLGTCPAHITISVPLASASHLRFAPWKTLTVNTTSRNFYHAAITIPEPLHLNQSVLDSLDSTFNTLDGQLTQSIHDTSDDVSQIHEVATTTTTDYVAYFAFGIGLLNLVFCFAFFCFRRSSKDVTLEKRDEGSASGCRGHWGTVSVVNQRHILSPSLGISKPTLTPRIAGVPTTNFITSIWVSVCRSPSLI